MKNYTISIVGGGIAGLSAAIALQQAGIETQVFESSSLLSPLGAGLGLGMNAMKAFEHLGIYDDVIYHGRSLPSFTIYDQNGKIITKTDFQTSKEFANFTIHRADLQAILLSKLDQNSIHTHKQILDFEQTDMGIRIQFRDGSSHFTNYLIAADGIHSAVRRKLIPEATPRNAGYFCWRAVINNESLSVDETSETWGAKGRFGIVPLASNKLYWFACINNSHRNKEIESYNASDLLGQFEHYHHPIPEILRHTKDEQLIRNNIIDLSPLKRYAFDRILLIGDAAHATTPNMGQGACQALEDAVILAKCLKGATNAEEAFRSFEKIRLERTKWVINTSRRIGGIAQMENPWLIKIRNKAFSMIPDSLTQKQLIKISQVDF